MMIAVIHLNAVALILYIASFIIVVWALADIARQPQWKMKTGRKAVWIVSCILGWLIFGVVGAVVAGIYLGAIRPRLSA